MTKKNYLERQQEWQKNQYSPGHFTGGTVPVWLSKPGKPRALSLVFIIAGAFILASSIFAGVQLYDEQPEILVGAIATSGLAIILILAGLKTWRKR